MDALRSERGSIVVGGLTKLLVLLAIFAVIAYDAIEIGYTHFNASDHGSLAADKAGDTWRETHSVEAAYEAAKATLEPTGEKIQPKSFAIDPDTDTITFTMTTHANTLVTQRIPWTEPLTVVKVTVQTHSAAP